MSEPKNAEEYAKKFHENQRVSGRFLDTTMHMPCPFCAEPDFRVFKVIHTETAWKEPATCTHCGRGVMVEITKDGGVTTFQFYQSSGPDQPEWYTPKMPRR